MKITMKVVSNSVRSVRCVKLRELGEEDGAALLEVSGTPDALVVAIGCGHAKVGEDAVVFFERS